MTIEQLVNRLQALAAEVPGCEVMLRRGSEDWFDHIEDVTLCCLDEERQGLDCDKECDEPGTAKVIVIR